MRRAKKKSHKKSEKANLPLLKSVPDDLPSLSRAYLLTKKASGVGFDWPNVSEVMGKLEEEMEEFKEALFLHDHRKISEEIGDLLFVWVNIARHLGVHPEKALGKTIQKFIRRFEYIEQKLRDRRKLPGDSTLDEMDQLWREAKKKGKKRQNPRR